MSSSQRLPPQRSPAAAPEHSSSKPTPTRARGAHPGASRAFPDLLDRTPPIDAIDDATGHETLPPAWFVDSAARDVVTALLDRGLPAAPGDADPDDERWHDDDEAFDIGALPMPVDLPQMLLPSADKTDAAVDREVVRATDGDRPQRNAPSKQADPRRPVSADARGGIALTSTTTIGKEETQRALDHREPKDGDDSHASDALDALDALDASVAALHMELERAGALTDHEPDERSLGASDDTSMEPGVRPKAAAPRNLGDRIEDTSRVAERSRDDVQAAAELRHAIVSYAPAPGVVQPQERLARLVEELSASLQVSTRTRADQWDIRLVLKSDILPQTALQMSSDGYRLTTRFITADPEIERMLRAHRDMLESALRRRCRLAIGVEVERVDHLR
jgi:hypothetical protein